MARLIGIFPCHCHRRPALGAWPDKSHRTCRGAFARCSGPLQLGSNHFERIHLPELPLPRGQLLEQRLSGASYPVKPSRETTVPIGFSLLGYALLVSDDMLAPHESRTTNLQSSRISRTGISGFVTLSSIAAMAATPISRHGW